MKKRFAATLLCLACAGAQAKTITIGIDLSGSNPMLTHPNFAAMAGAYVSKELESLENGDVVQVITFGARDEAFNMLNHRFEISRRQNPRRVADAIAQYLNTLPGKEDISQASTNLVAWLEFTSGFDCSSDGVILALTDGLESSFYVSGQQLLDGTASLPEPDIDLGGCSVTFFGLGAGWPAPQVKTVRNEWRNWFEKAGADFTAIIP